MTRSVIFIISLWCSVNLLQAKDYNITDFGAVSDTAVLSTKAIQAAIDRCSINGGEVVIPAGNYSTGTIYFKSNVTLRLEKGAILYGSRHLIDYPENLPDYTFYRKGSIKRALIFAEKCSNISIIGEGTINGQGEFFIVPDKAEVDSYSVRPYLIWMIQCTNVHTEGVRLRNSALWMQHYLACDNVYIHNVDVFNHCNKNNDMIDIDGCHDVRISDCTGDSDDDGITLKSTSGRANENVVITNCILSSHCNALKMGTESNTGFKNIAVSNIVIRPSRISEKAINGRPNGNAGIALEMVDGGVLDGVVISNIWIDGPNCPLFIRLGNRARPYYQGQKIEQVGVLQNVSINNVIAVNAKRTGCSITGIPGNPVRNINLSNISIEFEGGGTIVDAKRDIPEKEKSYPESDMFDILPSYGFFIRHAQNVTLNNVQLKTRNNDLRPAICLDDVQDSEFKNIKMGSQKDNQCNFMLSKTSGILISGCKIQGASNGFLQLKGEENSEIIVIDNLFTNVSSLITKDSKNKQAVREINNVK